MAAWRAGGGGDDGGLHCLVAGSHHGLFWHLGPICRRENADLEQGKQDIEKTWKKRCWCFGQFTAAGPGISPPLELQKLKVIPGVLVCCDQSAAGGRWSMDPGSLPCLITIWPSSPPSSVSSLSSPPAAASISTQIHLRITWEHWSLNKVAQHWGQWTWTIRCQNCWEKC